MANGWDGKDPRLRFLRSIAAAVLLVLLAFVIIDPSHDDAATLGFLFGALLVVLGFEANLRWPKP